MVGSIVYSFETFPTHNPSWVLLERDHAKDRHRRTNLIRISLWWSDSAQRTCNWVYNQTRVTLRCDWDWPSMTGKERKPRQAEANRKYFFEIRRNLRESLIKPRIATAGQVIFGPTWKWLLLLLDHVPRRTHVWPAPVKGQSTVDTWNQLQFKNNKRIIGQK